MRCLDTATVDTVVLDVLAWVRVWVSRLCMFKGQVFSLLQPVPESEYTVAVSAASKCEKEQACAKALYYI